MRIGHPVRLGVAIVTASLLAGCGTAAPDGAEEVEDRGAEVTVALPPAEPAAETAAPEPAEPEPSPPPISAAPPPPARPAADALTVPIEAAGARLVSAPPPLAMQSLGRYIRGAGFGCDEVAASSQLEREDGTRAGIYKFDCGSGESYQGTMRENHLYFREWRGIPAG